MAISGEIDKYIENSKIRGKLSKWKKNRINVFITPIVSDITNKEYYYSEIERAMSEWNKNLKMLGIDVYFISVSAPQSADVVIHWTKVGRVFEGMCKYLSVIDSEIRKVSIDVGLENEFSGKDTSAESIFFVMMHEFGHSLGLGHGIDIDDIMYVPHKKNVCTPSENDTFVLKTIYLQK